MLPDFIVIGAMKTGTTSLFHYLRDHPQVFMPWRKELHFFSHDANWERGVSWYEDQFANASPGQRVGEASPSYSKCHLFPATSDRLAEVIPKARIIYLVRDPVTRLQSQYLDMLKYATETRSITKAVATYDDYIHTSCYGMQLEPYVKKFGTERILVETSERLRADPISVVKRVLRFLDVDPAAMPRLKPIEANRSADKRIPSRLGRYFLRSRGWEDFGHMPEWTHRVLMRQSSHRAARLPLKLQRTLRDRFAPDIRLLQELVDVDLSDWPRMQVTATYR